MGAGYTAALIGGIAGAILLAIAIPIIRPVVLYLGAPELFSFCIFGLSMVAVLSGKATLEGSISACLGLMLAMIGSGSQTGTIRWTFDSLYLWDHLPLIPFTLGLFAMPELAEMAISRSSIARNGVKADFSLAAQWTGARDALKNWWLILRCSWLGAFLGTIPGLGAASIDWIAYGHAVRTEKNSSFGHGDIRGVIAPEASNNAKEGGHLIPTIAFGVPSGASMAVLLSAFLLHGLIPGPDMLTKHLDITFSMMWSLTLAHVLGAVICLAASGLFARLAGVPAGKLVPIVLALMFVSAIQGSQSWGDIYSLVFFGLVGWLMKLLGWPRPPLMLGFVLGSTFERYLFISTEIYGSAWVYRPAVIAILLLAAWAVFGPLKGSIKHTIQDLAGIKQRKIRFTGRIAFDVGLIAVLIAALWTASAWPWADKIVPLTAIYVGLVFSALNLLTEVFAAPSAGSAGEKSGAEKAGHAISHMDSAIGFGSMPRSLVLKRVTSYFCWLAGFLVVSTAIGFLPAILILIFLQSRFEFRQSWLFAFAAAVIVTGAMWFVFDEIFHLAWPVSMLGEAFPRLREQLTFI